MVDGEKVALNPAQYDEYQRLGGAAAQAALRQAIGSADWRAMTDDERNEFVQEAFKDARKGARGELLDRHSELGGRALPLMTGALALPAKRRQQTMSPPPPGYQIDR